jgi:hypothetical protein
MVSAISKAQTFTNRTKKLAVLEGVQGLFHETDYIIVLEVSPGQKVKFFNRKNTVCTKVIM